MKELKKSAPIGRKAYLERVIAQAKAMGEPQLAAPEMAELSKILTRESNQAIRRAVVMLINMSK